MSPSRIALEFNQTRSSPDLSLWEAQIDGLTVLWVASGAQICPQLYLSQHHAREGGGKSFQRMAEAILSNPWPPQLERITYGIRADILYAAVDLEGR